MSRLREEEEEEESLRACDRSTFSTIFICYALIIIPTEGELLMKKDPTIFSRTKHDERFKIGR